MSVGGVSRDTGSSERVEAENIRAGDSIIVCRRQAVRQSSSPLLFQFCSSRQSCDFLRVGLVHALP